MTFTNNAINNTLAAAQLTGTVAVASGGTGQTSYTDGQLLIGNSSGNTLSKATLTAGANVTITNGNGSITIAASGGGGGGSPGGSSGQIQFNSSGSFGGALLNIDAHGHLTSNSDGTTTIAAGAGAGTSPTISITGNDVCGIINLTTGSSPSANATIGTISFANAYGSAPKAVIITPQTGSGVQPGRSAGVGTISTTAWQLFSFSSGALSASTAYAWYYLVIG